MGVNFYLQRKATMKEQAVLDKLNVKLPQLHIGKSSYGWEFLFCAHDKWDLEPFDIDLPGINDIETWNTLFDDDRFEIIDEDGRVMSATCFIEYVMVKRGGKNHIIECLKKPSDRSHVQENCFFDRTGHPFCRGEFS